MLKPSVFHSAMRQKEIGASCLHVAARTPKLKIVENRDAASPTALAKALLFLGHPLNERLWFFFWPLLSMIAQEPCSLPRRIFMFFMDPL